MMLICSNSYHLNTQRKYIENLMGNTVVVSTEQTSSHGIIAKSLNDLKVRIFLLPLNIFIINSQP